MLALHSCYSPPKFAVDIVETYKSEILLPMKASKSTILVNDIMDSIAGILFAQVCQPANIRLKEAQTFDLLDEKDSSDLVISKQTVFTLLKHIFEQCELEYQCLVCALIYVDRMQNISGFRLNARNWRSCIVVSLMLASKILDDFSVNNTCFAWHFGVDVEKINQLERVVLTMLRYSLFISAAEYTAYHSAARAMADNHRRSKTTLTGDIYRFKVPYPVTPPQRVWVKQSQRHLTCDFLKQKRSSDYISPGQSPTTTIMSDDDACNFA